MRYRVILVADQQVMSDQLYHLSFGNVFHSYATFKPAGEDGIGHRIFYVEVPDDFAEVFEQTVEQDDSILSCEQRAVDEVLSLTTETQEAINRFGHTVDEVRYITDGKSWCTWSEFFTLAASTFYDPDYGPIFINDQLKVVGNVWWLERRHTDGQEWWEYVRLPLRPIQHAAVILENFD